ncbi:unnamed protein product [Effrenium voratum]|nr:unnamed protein product [Effrenium voratum]
MGFTLSFGLLGTGRAHLMARLARQQERPDADPEPLVRGLLLMESAWQKDQVRESRVMSRLLGHGGKDPGPMSERFGHEKMTCGSVQLALAEIAHKRFVARWPRWQNPFHF